MPGARPAEASPGVLDASKGSKTSKKVVRNTFGIDPDHFFSTENFVFFTSQSVYRGSLGWLWGLGTRG